MIKVFLYQKDLVYQLCVLYTCVLNILCLSVLYICVYIYLHRTSMCAGVRLGPYVCVGVSVVFLYHTCPYVYSGYTTHIQKHVSGYMQGSLRVIALRGAPRVLSAHACTGAYSRARDSGVWRVSAGTRAGMPFLDPHNKWLVSGVTPAPSHDSLVATYPYFIMIHNMSCTVL